MNEMSKTELAQLIEEFICDNGLWNDFTEYIENKGYKIEELPSPLNEV